MEAGGYATSRSMRFQNLWAVRQVLHVLAEELRSVRIEPAGLEGKGVDLIVTLPGGNDEYQQCKRLYGQTGKWTLKALENEGVITALRERLQTNRLATFKFVSIDPAPDLQDLCDSAVASLNAESFLRDQIDAAEKRKQSFGAFSRALRLDPQKSDELAQIYSLLRRTSTTRMDDDSDALRELRSHARYWVDGKPDSVIAALESYTQQNLRIAITAASVEEYLRGLGFHLRALSRDTRILPAIRQLQARFEESLEPYLVGGALLPREEADQLFDLLAMEGGPTFVAVHGPAGVGKSGALLALTRRLQQQGILHLPLRLDRQRPHGVTSRFGDSLGLPASPAFCLKAAAGEGIGVLVLDQLDALRWTGSQAAEALETCRELVREVIQSSNLRVVASCRSFYLENDPQIRGWIERQHARKLPVGRLSEETVKKMVTAIGVDWERLNARQIDLLRTIYHLRTWEETVKVTGEIVGFATEWDLLDEFWRSRFSETERMGVSATVVQEALDDVVTYMDKNGRLDAPRRLLLKYGRAEEVLLSLQVLTVTDGSVTFSHQGYLDHQLAYLLLRRIDEGKTTIEEWLTGGHQGLFRREQLRLVLGLLREERNDRYIATIQVVVASPKVRFHLKQVVLEVLGQVAEPHPAEIELVSSLFQEEQWQEHVLADIYYAHPPWIDSEQGTSLLSDWLEDEEWKRDKALHLIRSVIKQRGQLCSRLLEPYVGRGDDWNHRVASVLPSAPADDPPELFALRVRLAEMGGNFHFIDWKELGDPGLDRLVQFLTAILSGLEREKETSRHSSLLRGIEEVDLSEVPLEALSDAWAVLLSTASKVLGPAESPPFEVTLGSSPHDWRSPLRELLRRLTGELVSRAPLGAIDLVEQSGLALGELLLLEALPRIKDSLVADRALEWLMSSPDRLRLRWWGSDLPWQVSRSAVGNLTHVCSPGHCTAFECFLVRFQEPRLREEMEWRHDALLFPPEGQPRFHDWLLTLPSSAGGTAYHLLPCFPKERLSDLSRQRLRELQRKFASADEVFFSGSGKGQGGSVSSPLPRERLNELSDWTWLQIIAKNSISRPDIRYRGYRDGRYEKSSPGTFASDLQTATAREPGRFARLAIRFPEDTNPVYLRAVLQGLTAETQDHPVAEEVSIEELEALLGLPRIIAEPTLAMAVARLIAHSPQLDWGTSTLYLLSSIATSHPDPGTDEPHIEGGGGDDWSPENLVNKSLNCTRGAATFSIGELLFGDTARLQFFADAIERLAADPHPAVRAAVFECCLAVLRVAPERSITWALQTAGETDTLLACSTFDRFLRYASRNHPEAMEPTIRRMLISSREDVVRGGARHATALHLLFGRMKKEVEDCIHGTVAERTGAAQVAAAFADSPEYHSRARAILTELMNDNEKKVLEACAEALHDTTLDLFADSLEFLNAYASSRAFQFYPFILLYRLKEHPEPLGPFAGCVLELCRNLAAAGRAQRDKSFWEADYYLPPVLLRLYEQAPEDSQVREQALDAWDILLGARVATAVSLTKKLESES